MLLDDVGIMVETLLQRQSGNALERDDRNGCRLARTAGIDADHRVAARRFDGEPGAQVGAGCIHPRENIAKVQRCALLGIRCPDAAQPAKQPTKPSSRATFPNGLRRWAWAMSSMVGISGLSPRFCYRLRLECSRTNVARSARLNFPIAACIVHSNNSAADILGSTLFSTMKVSMQAAAARLFPSRNG